MDMVTTLLSGAEPFKQIVNIHLTDKKSGENWLSGFQRWSFKITWYILVHLYSTEAMANNPGEKNFGCN